MKQVKIDLGTAKEYQESVQGSRIGLIVGLTIVLMAVCVTGLMILKKRNDDYWADDEDEGGEKEDYFKRMVDSDI